MAEFVCRVGTPSGEVVTRMIEANAERDLAPSLNAKGSVFSISSSAA